MPASPQELQAHVREVARLAEVVGALAKQFDRQPDVEVLVTLKRNVEALAAAWARAEAILSGK